MMVADDIQVQLETIDEQIITLLAQRRDLFEGSDLVEDLGDTVGFYVDRAADLNLDESVAEKLARVISKMSEKVEE